MFGLQSLPCLSSQWNQRVQAVFAQEDPTPYQPADIDWEEEVGEHWVADAQVSGDCAAQKSGQQNRAKDRGTRNRIDGSTDEFEYPDPGSETIGISELSEGRHDRSRVYQLSDAVEDQK